MSSSTMPASISKKSGKSKQIADSTIKPASKIINLDNQEFSTPKMTPEQKAIYASQVIIPTIVSDKTLGVMGPLISTERLEKTKGFFPAYFLTKPIINKSVPSKLKNDDSAAKLPKTLEGTSEGITTALTRDPFNMDYVTVNFKPFRSCPTSDQSYQNWLATVECKKSQEWENLGILNLIQMSKLGFSYSHPFLLASLYFWDSTYNTFHLPCGMLTPPFFDIAAITGLSPIGETFDPNEDADNLIDFDVKNANFSK